MLTHWYTADLHLGHEGVERDRSRDHRPSQDHGFRFMIYRESRGRPVVSTQKALTELVRRTSERTEYGALLTSWAAWCAAHVDPAVERGVRREALAAADASAGAPVYTPAADPAPEPPAPASYATIREAIGHADLSEGAAERLEALLRLKVEVARHRSLGSDYAAPEAALRVSELHPPAGRAPDPWPFIEALRAPALAVLEAARAFGVEEGRDDPEYRGGIADFPALEDRIRLAVVVARAALFCAETESRVKNCLHERTGNDPDACWAPRREGGVETPRDGPGSSPGPPDALARPSRARPPQRGLIVPSPPS